MTHGGMGLLTKNWIWLPHDLLRPLSIFNGDEVYGFYYPTPTLDGRHGNCPEIDDIMFTPIPPNLWGRVARLAVRLKQEQGMLAPICKFLADSNISIVDAECTRSAHRYATWNAVIGFESDLGQDADVQEKLRQLREDLCKNFKGTNLFDEANIHALEEPVETYSMHSLQYFHGLLKRDGSVSELKHRDFRFTVVEGKLKDEDRLLPPLIATMPGIDHRNPRPLCVFAEADTRSFVIRMAIVPPQKLNSYFKATIPYERITGGSSCGLLSTILGGLPNQYNLWRVFNDTNENKAQFEKGEATLFGQDISKAATGMPGEDVAMRVSAYLKEFEAKPIALPHSRVMVGPSVVKPLQYLDIRENLVQQQEQVQGFKYRVFLSSDDRDLDFARDIHNTIKDAGIDCFWYKADVVGGTRIPDAIRHAVLQSKEMCVLVTEHSLTSIWVASEWGAMWAEGRPIISIVTPDVDHAQLPEQLRSLAFYRYRSGVDQYIRLLQQR